jgi:SAM-dependent methyltransferase
VTGEDVLELGCGAGFYTRLLLEKCVRHVWAVDFSEAMLAALPSHGVTPVLSDAASVALSREFTTVLSAGLLEFMPEPASLFRSAARHCRPNGRFVILFPPDDLAGRAYRLFHKRNGVAIQLFSETDIEKLSSATGWSVETLHRAGPASVAARLTRT